MLCILEYVLSFTFYLSLPVLSWIDQSENSGHNVGKAMGTLMCVYNVVYKIELLQESVVR